MKSTLIHLATKDDIVDLHKKISESKADTFKWMFIFWLSQVGTILAIALLLLNK